MKSDTDHPTTDIGITSTHELSVPFGTEYSRNSISHECVVSFEKTNSRNPEMTKIFIGEDKETEHQKKILIADLANVSAPYPEEINETIDFDEATKMIPPTMEHIEGYICSLADCQSIIAMIREDGKNIMVRIPATATIIGEKKMIRASTAKIGHPIRLYQIIKGQIEWKRQPTLSTIKYYSRLISVVGPMGPTIPTIAAVADHNKIPKIISGHVPTGMTTKQPMLFNGKIEPIHQGSIGTLLHAEAYELSPFMKVLKYSDCDIYVKDIEEVEKRSSEIESRPKLFALTNLRRLESKELLNIEQRCKNIENPSLDELELWVGRATATLAAHHTFISNKNIENAKIVEVLDYHRAENFTASWKMKTSRVTEEMYEIFASGEMVEVSFRCDKTRESYTITAKIASVKVVRDDTQFGIAFSPFDTRFLEQWISDMDNKKRAVNITPVTFKEDTHETILAKFRQLPSTRIGSQLLGRMSGQINHAIISDESRQIGSIQLDDCQTAALARIVGSTGMTITVAPTGSGKTTLVAAVTREWITNGDCDRVIITGPTNFSLRNALEVIQSSVTSEDIRTLRHASETAIAGATNDEHKTMSFYMAQRFEEFISEDDQRKELKQLRQDWLSAKSYAENLECPIALIQAYNAEKEARIDLTGQFEVFYNPNVVAITTALLLKVFDDNTSDQVTHIIIDDAHLLRPSDLMAIVCKFQKLESLMLIGDTAQFSPYLPTKHNSDMYKCFEQSDMSRLDKTCPQESIKLNTVYGIHPDITRQLIAPNYHFNLEVGNVSNQHTLAKDLKLPTADSGSPIQFIHIDGREVDGENRDEADVISRFVNTLLNKGLAPNDLLILVHHRNQLDLLQSLITNITIKTINAAQGQRAPVTIIATTKTSGGSEETIRRSFRFVSNPKRATVAVSRAKEAVYVFGSLIHLENTDFWKPLIEISREQGGIFYDVSHRKRRVAYAWTRNLPDIRFIGVSLDREPKYIDANNI